MPRTARRLQQHRWPFAALPTSHVVPACQYTWFGTALARRCHRQKAYARTHRHMCAHTRRCARTHAHVNELDVVDGALGDGLVHLLVLPDAGLEVIHGLSVLLAGRRWVKTQWTKALFMLADRKWSKTVGKRIRGRGRERASLALLLHRSSHGSAPQVFRPGTPVAGAAGDPADACMHASIHAGDACQVSNMHFGCCMSYL